MNSVAVVGAGAWGTALALHAARLGREVTLWARHPGPLLDTRRNARLPGTVLPASIAITGTLPEAADAVILAVPTQHMRAVLTGWRPPAPVVLCMKGIEAGTGLLPAKVLAALHPGVPSAILTGPNFAHEVADGLPAAAVIAAGSPALREALLHLLAGPTFRLYGNDDPVGAQLGGAAKNVIAIAAGAVMGAGLGENARAALITRGLAELGRLVVALGGRAETVAGLSGLGDLLLTCTGGASRNYQLGLALGRGAAVADALAGLTGVAEGAATAPALTQRAGDTELPVCAAVAALLQGSMTLDQAIASLLARPPRDE